MWRRWRTRPLMPALVLVVLAGGIGASAAVLGLAWAAVVRPLPVPDSDALVLVTTDFPGMKLTGMGLSGAEAMEFAELTTAFSAVGFGYAETGSVTLDAATVQGDVAHVSAGVFRTLAVTPRSGRVFTDDEDVPGGPALAVLQDGFWRRAFGGADVLGRTIRVDGLEHTIVGVLPPRVDFAGKAADVWVTLRYDRSAPSSNRSNHAFTVIGRMRAGTTREQAVADVNSAVERWARDTGQMHTPAARFHPVILNSYVDAVIGPIRPAAGLPVAAVVLVLLATAANAASLLAADAQTRRTEFAVRAALGASRWQQWRVPLTETAVLAVLAGLCGGCVAWLGSGFLLSVAPPALVARDLSLPAWQAFAGAGSLALVAACGCALASVAHLPQQQLSRTLIDGETRTGAAGSQWLRRGLVCLEVALAVVLAAGASIMGESVWRLSHVTLGFTPAQSLRASVNLPEASYPAAAQIERFYQQLTDRVLAQPGVDAVGMMTGLPPQRRPNNSTYQFDGSTVDLHSGLPPLQFIQIATPGFFKALDVQLITGRLLAETDSRDSQPVVLMNHRAAEAFFPGKDPVGQRLRPMSPGRPWLTVVGVVADMRQAGLASDPGTEIFVPLPQAHHVWGSPPADLHVVVRTVGDPDAVSTPLRRIVAELEPAAAVGTVEVMQTTVDRSIAAQRFLAALLIGFAAMAVLLSLTGVYGVLTHLVTARTREIGIRRALGASPRAVASLMARQIVGLLAAGLVAGVLAAVAGAQLLTPFIYQTSPVDPWRAVSLAVLVVSIAALASALPLARALRIDPARALLT